MTSLLATTVYQYIQLPLEIKPYSKSGHRLIQYIIFNNTKYEGYATDHFVVSVIYAICLVTFAIFFFPVILMLYVQLKNFLKNRTTKEQYSKVKKIVPPQTPPKKKREPTRTETFSSNCMYSESEEEFETPFVTNEKSADQIIYEFGAPQDFSGRNCSSMHNFWSMCFDTKIPNQMDLFSKLTVRVDMNSIFHNTSLMKINETPQGGYQYVPGSFSVDASSNILYQPFKYNDIEEENSVRIYETGFGNRPTNLEGHKMSAISEEY